MKTTTLYNGINMPCLLQGLPLILGKEKIQYKQFFDIFNNTIKEGIYGFDTSHDYGKSEEFIGKSIEKITKGGIIKRNQIFITTKIGNSQQYEGNIEHCVDESLKKLRVKYIDCMLLHWPVPDLYIDNWRKLEKIYEKGKIKSIGIANVKLRHLIELAKAGVNIKPHVIQTEIHPFNTCKDIREYCQVNNITIQSCSPLCQMIPEVYENQTLVNISHKYGKSVAQIILRWELQQNINPVFRAFKSNHIREMNNLSSFEISKEDCDVIEGLNQDYRFHPESSNCAGF